jgi:hypothetical protein
MTPNPPVNQPPQPTPQQRRPVRSILRYAVPLVLLVAVVFALTFFSIYTPRRDEVKPQQGGDPPLVFSDTTRFWHPPWEVSEEKSARLQNRNFAGFYEAGEEGKAVFWFENRNPAPVTLRLIWRSCGACSKGAVYLVPPDVARAAPQASAAAVGSPITAGVTTASPMALLDLSRLTPDAAFPFEDQDKVVFHIPPANNPDGSPQLGALELGFVARPPTEPRQLRSKFRSEVEGNPTQVEEHDFGITFEVSDPIRVFPESLDAGTVEESGSGVTREFLVFSCTRVPGERFPAPTVVMFAGGSGEAGKLVQAEAPVLIPAEEYESLSFHLSQQLKRPVHVTGAYRVAVKINPKADSTPPDIGQFERSIQVSIPKVDAKHLATRGLIRGGVWLTNGNAIELPSFRGKDGVTETFELVSDRTDVELEEEKGMQQPDFVEVAVDKKEDLGGKRYFNLRVRIPQGKQLVSFTNGVVVLKVKGSNRRIRIPLKGTVRP